MSVNDVYRVETHLTQVWHVSADDEESAREIVQEESHDLKVTEVVRLEVVDVRKATDEEYEALPRG